MTSRVFEMHWTIEAGIIGVPADAWARLAVVAIRGGCPAERFANALPRLADSLGHAPWAVICFETSLPVGGHLAQLRGRKHNLPYFSFAALGRQGPPVRPGRLELVSGVVVRRKAILQRLAAQSPLLQPAWNILQGRPHTGTWLCLAESLPAEVVHGLQPGDGARYLAAIQRDTEPIAIETSSMPEALVDVVRSGQQHMAAGAWRLAAKDWRLAVAGMPRSALVWHNLGLCLFRAGRVYAAITCARKAIALHPFWQNARYDLAFALLGVQRHPEAIQVLSEILEADPFSERAWMMLAVAHREQQQWPESVAAIGRYFELQPDDTENGASWAHTLQAAGRYPDAAQAFQLLVEQEPENCEHWNNLGYALAEAGDADAAVLACGRALAIRPDLSSAWDSLGYAHFRAGRFDDAISALLRAIEISPDHREAWNHLVQAYERSGQTARMRGAQKYASGLTVPNPS